MPYCPACSASVPPGAERCPTCGAPTIPTPSSGALAGPQPPPLDTQRLHDELQESLRPQYELLRLLGAGGMGAVFLAREPALRRLVAVKVLSPTLTADPQARARFEREARAAAALSHPNVVRVYAVGQTTTSQLPYIIMQYVEGQDLGRWLAHHGRATEREARRIIGEVAAGLAAAHARELVHRDVKPANVLLEADSGRAFVADFGVSAALADAAQTASSSLTAAGMIVGTPAYMSPEQLAGEGATPKSDVYSLGIVTYEILTGEPPFKATTVLGLAASHLRDTPPRMAEVRPDVSPAVASLIDRCLAKRPDRRPSAEEVARAMLPSLATEVEWPPPGLEALRARALFLGRTLLIAAMVGLLAVIAVAFTPDILEVHPNWLLRFQVTEVGNGLRAMTPETGDVSFFIWQTLLVIGVAVIGLGLLYLIDWLWRTSRDVLRYRALGWRWSTLCDVAVDPDGRTGLVLAGAREFASLEPEERRVIVLTRRFRAAALMIAALWLMTALALWALAAATGFLSGGATGPLAGTLLVASAGLPAAVLLAATLWLTIRERRMVGPVSRRPHDYVGSAGDVARWYRGAQLEQEPIAMSPRRVSAARWARWTALATAGVAAIIVATGLIELVTASTVAARFVQRVGPRAAEALASLTGLATDDPLGQAEQTWRPFLPRRDPLPDSTALSLLRSLSDQPGAASLPPYDSTVTRLYRSARTLADVLAELRPGTLPPDTVRALRALASHPRTLAFRRLARAQDVNLLGAALDRPLRRYRNVDAIPLLSIRSLQLAARANALTALLAVNQGDLATAKERLGENLAMAGHFLRAAVLPYNLWALHVLHGETLPELVAYAQRIGDLTTAHALRDAAGDLDRVDFSPRGAAGLTADTTQIFQLADAIAQYHLMPGQRLQLVFAIWNGLCGNPREILAGPSRARRTAALQAASRLDDIPRATELADLIGRERWEDPAATALTSWPAPLRVLITSGPAATFVRVRHCADIQ